jgi:hypothetical protein
MSTKNPIIIDDRDDGPPEESPIVKTVLGLRGELVKLQIPESQTRKEEEFCEEETDDGQVYDGDQIYKDDHKCEYDSVDEEVDCYNYYEGEQTMAYDSYDDYSDEYEEDFETNEDLGEPLTAAKVVGEPVKSICIATDDTTLVDISSTKVPVVIVDTDKDASLEIDEDGADSIKKRTFLDVDNEAVPKISTKRQRILQVPMVKGYLVSGALGAVVGSAATFYGLYQMGQ